MSDKLRQLSINLPENLISKIDEYSKEMNLNRTSSMIVLINTSLEQRKNIATIEDMLEELKKEKGEENDR